MSAPAAPPRWSATPEGAALWRRELAKGKRYEAEAAARLRDHGLDVRESPHRVAPREAAAIAAFTAGDADLVVEGRRVEVKSHRQPFRSLDEYPFPLVIADTVHGWDHKAAKPCAILHVSQPTLAIVVTPVSTEPTWTRGVRLDPIRGARFEFYLHRREQLRPLQDFVEWLRRDRQA